MKKGVSKAKLKQGLGLALFIFLSIIAIYPVIWMVLLSLKDDMDIWSGNIMGFPETWHFENYVDAWQQAHVSRYFMNSVIVVGLTILLVVVFSTMAAYALTRMRWKGRELALVIFITGMMIPTHAALLPDMLILKSLKWLDTYLALIIPFTAFTLCSSIYILSGFYQNIPKEMEEAACIDGANIIQTFWYVIVPMIRPAISTISVFAFIWNWNEVMFGNVYINSDNLRTLTVGILQMQGQYQVHWGPMAAGLSIATIPVIIIYLVLNKQIQQSFIAGAVKG